jgi:glycosyltransferase involved in cell wall biosynthesis
MNERRPLRLLHLLPWIGGGGVERRRLELARRLPRDRFEMHVACFGQLAWHREFRDAGVTVHELGGGSPHAPDVILRLLEHVRAIRPDVVHGAVFEGVQMAVLAGRALGVEHVIVEETGDAMHRHWRGHQLMRACCALADAVVGVSYAVRENLIASGVDPDRIRVIENGVGTPIAPPEPRSELRAAWGLSEDDFVVVSAGRLRNDHKRFTDLVEATALLAPKIPSLKCVIVGDGSDRMMIQEHAAKHGVADRVILPGFVSDMGRALVIADVFAMVSERESFGLALVEAMLFGLPCVATRVGGMVAILDDGKAGIAVEPYQPPQIGDAIERLWSSAALRAELAQRGCAHANERFGAGRYAEQVASLYDELRAGRSEAKAPKPRPSSGYAPERASPR